MTQILSYIKKSVEMIAKLIIFHSVQFDLFPTYVTESKKILFLNLVHGEQKEKLIL